MGIIQCTRKSERAAPPATLVEDHVYASELGSDITLANYNSDPFQRWATRT